MDDTELRHQLERSRQLGFLGPGPVETHLRHADGFVELLSSLEPGAWMDLGSGGGIPGLVVGVRVPTSTITLVDANERRVAFLRDAIRRLGLDDRLSAVVGRAEVLAHDPALRERFDVVMARSFGPPAVLAECAVGFLTIGGRLLVSEPQHTTDRWPIDGLAMLDLEPLATHAYDRTRIQELRRRGETDLTAIPRSVGVPGRRPLFT